MQRVVIATEPNPPPGPTELADGVVYEVDDEVILLDDSDDVEIRRGE